MIVLDTSAVIELLDGTEKGKRVQQRIQNEIVAISAVTVNEVIVGAQGAQKRMIYDFIKSSHIISFDEIAALRSATLEEELAKKGKPIGKLDTFIAATCSIHDVELITADNDFKNVEKLCVFFV